jgi:hypothetical protein
MVVSVGTTDYSKASASIKPLSIRYELGAGPEREVTAASVPCSVPGYAAVDRTLSLRTNDIVLTADLAAP